MHAHYIDVVHINVCATSAEISFADGLIRGIAAHLEEMGDPYIEDQRQTEAPCPFSEEGLLAVTVVIMGRDVDGGDPPTQSRISDVFEGEGQSLVSRSLSRREVITYVLHMYSSTKYHYFSFIFHQRSLIFISFFEERDRDRERERGRGR